MSRHNRRASGSTFEPPALEQIPVWAAEEEAVSEESPDQGLEALLEGLNPEQRNAVCHAEGPLLVIAGAGTGKTQVVTRRVAWLIATRRARPSEILALTFTDKAADEMQTRVDQLVPYGYTDATVSTFHAFGDRIVREFALELGLPTDLRVISRPESIIFMRERLFAFDLDEYRPLGDPTRFLGALATLFSRCKDEDVSPADYVRHAAGLQAQAVEVGSEQPQPAQEAEAAAEEARRQAELAHAYEKYQSLLRSTGLMDFGDQVGLALRLLRESPAARLELQRRYRYILVDEFQDTNKAQSELVELLAAPHGNLTVVGDDDQSIYKFRGAAISNILEFKRRHPRTRQIVLRRNYRSMEPILDAAYRLIRFNDPDRLEVRNQIDKRLVAVRRGETRPVRHLSFETASAEADWVASQIRDRVAAGARPADFAILVRSNADADPILRSLNIAALPWRFSGATGLYGRPEIRLLLAFLRAVADLSSSVDLYALLSSEVYGIGGEDLVAIVNTARRKNRSLWEIVEELTRQPGLLRLGPETRKALEKLVADLRRYVESSQSRPAGEVLYQFLRESGMLSRLASGESTAAEEALGNVARFFEIIRAQSRLLSDDRVIFLARHLQTLIEAGDDPATAEMDSDANAVSVLTVHKAKGLEFPVVFMVGLADGRFPARGRREALPLPAALVEEVLPEGDAHVQEERRLFYVGMTRARDELLLSHAGDYGGRRARRVSQFVLEALDLPASTAPTPVESLSSSPLEVLARFEGRSEPVEAGLEAPVGPLSLSFYQVDDYLTCPRKYKYVHVLRVPIAPHHSIVYGSALHQAVQEFHKRQARGYLMSDDELTAAFERAWSNEGFLTREHEEARLAAGREALHRFRESQLTPGTVVPAYVEREFSFGLEGDRIRGRMDRVDIERLPSAGATDMATATTPERQHADEVSPALPGFYPERVTITDYKSSDVRDPARARDRARDSLQLQIYAMGYQAETGRLPDALQLWFLESGLIGRVEVDPKRLERARESIKKAAAGIRARHFEASPDYLACGYCAFRDICPESAAR